MSEQEAGNEAAAILEMAVGKRTVEAVELIAMAPNDPRRKYRQGLCDAMALALHRRTGLPLGLIGGAYDDNGEEAVEICHAVVRVGSDAILDVDGVWKMSELGPAPGCFSNRTTAIRLLDSSVDQVTGIFRTEGVSEAQIEEALAFIDADEKLAAEVAAFPPSMPGP